MLIVLLVLVIVIAQGLSAGAAYILHREASTAECSRKIGANTIISLASEAEDFAWRPLLHFFK